MSFRLLAYWFDDNAKEGDRFIKGVDEAFRQVDPRISVAWTPVTDVFEAGEILDSTERQIDVAFIDVRWRESRQKDPVDKSVGLLEKALRRRGTVVILCSEHDTELIRYLYDPALAHLEPHALLAKGLASRDGGAKRAAIETAFANAGVRLRTREMAVEWDFSLVTPDFRTSVPDLVVDELAASLRPDSTEVLVAPLSGGLSGAGTFLVNTLTTDLGRETRLRFFLKVQRDGTDVKKEDENHRELVPRFNDGLFVARVDDVRRYGPWRALAFRAGDGVAFGSALDANLKPAVWSTVFSTGALRAYVDNSSAAAVDIGSRIFGEDGILTPTRMARLVRAANRLGIPELGSEDSVRDMLIEKFGGRPKTVVTVVHGDLHHRNVLVSAEGVSKWVDAASMSNAGVWCEDLARFAVWCAVDSLGSRTVANDLAKSVLAQRLGSRGASLLGRLESNVQRTRDNLVAGLLESRRPIDAENDWRLMVAVELFRAGYSQDFFPSRQRRTALRAALLVVDGIRRPGSPSVL